MDASGIHVGGIEGSAVPFDAVVVVGMLGIGDGFEKLAEAGNAADILGRAAQRPVDEARVARGGIGGEQLLDLEPMLPAVAHVVDIDEALDAVGGELVEADAAGADRARDTEPFSAHARPGDGLPADVELVEVIVLPAHRRLDHGVQVLEGQRRGHLDPAPDRRLGVGEHDLQPNDGIAHAARVAGSGFQFQGRSSATRFAG